MLGCNARGNRAMDERFWDEAEAGALRRQHRAEQQAAKPNGRDPGISEVHDAGDIDVTKIPPRGFLLGVTFCRNFISGLIAEGAGGKTAIRYAQFLAASTGRNLTGEHVHVRCRVLIVCLEDHLDEVKRRIGAAMLRHGVTPDDVKAWLFYWTPKGLKLLQIDPHGVRATGVLHSELRKIISELKIDIVAIDPFVKSHGVEENDNNAIDQVCIMLAELADEFDCAVDLVHHARKGAATPGDADRSRGASSMVWAGRLMRTVTGMTADEAELFGVADKDRGALVRVDDAKVNITPRSAEAMWFKLVGVALGNATTLYPHGDNVQTVVRWFPSDAFAKLTTTTINRILDKIEAGPYEGGRYSPAPNAKDRAAWPVIQEFCPDLGEKQAKHVIAKWLKTSVLVKRDHPDPKSRREQVSLFVGKRPGDTWDS
jgi:hypothetical protein